MPSCETSTCRRLRGLRPPILTAAWAPAPQEDNDHDPRGTFASAVVMLLASALVAAGCSQPAPAKAPAPAKVANPQKEADLTTITLTPGG